MKKEDPCHSCGNKNLCNESPTYLCCNCNDEESQYKHEHRSCFNLMTPDNKKSLTTEWEEKLGVLVYEETGRPADRQNKLNQFLQRYAKAIRDGAIEECIDSLLLLAVTDQADETIIGKCIKALTKLNI